MQDEKFQGCSSVGNYAILKTLGSGLTAKVKLGVNRKTNEKVAVKVIDPKNPSINFKDLSKEIQIMVNLSNDKHPHVIQMIEWINPAEYIKKNGTKKSTMAIVMELLENGELFEYVVDAGGFPEEICRNLFKKMVDTLAYCHKKGIAHRDLKPENLLIDSKFNVKFVDFGFATAAKDADTLSSYKGTEAYMAPEILEGCQYNGFKVDIFALGTILFIMYAGFPAYASKADPQQDPWFKLFTKNNSMFWKYHAKRKPEGFFQEDFMDLFNKLCAYDPDQRISIEELAEHPWLKGKTASDKEKDAFFKQIKEAVDSRIETEREEKKKAKEQAAQMAQSQEYAFKGIKPFNRSEESINEDAKLMESIVDFSSKRNIREHIDQGFKALTEIKSALPLDMVFKVVCVVASKVASEIEVSKDEYKVNCKINKDEGKCRFKIMITKIDDELVCVEFKKTEGDTMFFYRYVDDIKKQIIFEEKEQKSSK